MSKANTIHAPDVLDDDTDQHASPPTGLVVEGKAMVRRTTAKHMNKSYQ
jgi:hypothetical protein